MLEDELGSVSLLVREGEDGSYRFTHPSWQEYFTEVYLINEVCSGRLSFAKALDYFWPHEIVEAIERWKRKSRLSI